MREEANQVQILKRFMTFQKVRIKIGHGITNLLLEMLKQIDRKGQVLSAITLDQKPKN